MPTQTETLFKLRFELNPQDGAHLAVFAFDQQGNLLASSPMESGEVKLGLNEEQVKNARIFISSAPPDPQMKPTLRAMVRAGALEPKLQYDKEKGAHVVSLPRPLPPLPPWRLCHVRGKVVRPIEACGVTTEMPVFGARVHIHDVDPLPRIILRLPDDIIDRIREHLIELHDQPLFPPHIIPDPPPDPVWKMRIPVSPAESKGMLLRTAKGSLSGTALSKAGTKVWTGTGVKAKTVGDTWPAALTAALSTSSRTYLRQALVENATLLRPHLCLFPWLQRYAIEEQLAVATSGMDGTFATNFLWGEGDQPDLYFWVEYCLGGTWTSVYHPSMMCGTYWSYSGSEVVIRIQDPRVPWVVPPLAPGKAVAVMSIGNGISTSELQLSSAGGHEGLTLGGEPLGGVLEPHVFFDHDALAGTGITHYRWSYRPLGSTGAWTPLTRRVNRHYAVVTPSPFHLDFFSYNLGPDPAYSGMNLFQVPPKDPPAGSAGWFVLDAREDTATAFFDSTSTGGPGKYELKLELFRNGPGGMAVVDLTAAGVQLCEAVEPAPFGASTIHTRAVPADPAYAAEEERVIRDPATHHVLAYRLVVQVDNRPCVATINDSEVSGNAAGPCGFISYNGAATPVSISFRAWQPGGFAHFQFLVSKGSSGPVTAACEPVPGNPLPQVIADTNGYTHDAQGTRSKNPALHVSDLVGSCPGGVAAFAETLYVYAMATDGWSRLYYLDASAIPHAFALQPTNPPTP